MTIFNLYFTESFLFYWYWFIHPLIKNFPIIFSLLFMLVAFVLLKSFEHFEMVNITNTYIKLYTFWCIFGSWSFHAGFFNTIYNNFFIIILKNAYLQINKYLDKGFFEYFGPFGLYKSIRFLHIQLNFSNYSIIFFSISFMFVGVILFVWYWVIIISLLYLYLIKIIGILPLILLNFLWKKKELFYENIQLLKKNL